MPQTIRIRAGVLPPLAVILLLAALISAPAHAQSPPTVNGQPLRPVSIDCAVVTKSDERPELQTIPVGPGQNPASLCPDGRHLVAVTYHLPGESGLPPPSGNTGLPPTGHPP